MTHEATLEKMVQMKLFGMANAFNATMEKGIEHNFTSDEIIAHLIDSEWEERYNRRLTRLLKSANLRFNCSFEQINFNHKRNLDKKERKHNYYRTNRCRKKFSCMCTWTPGMPEWIQDSIF